LVARHSLWQFFFAEIQRIDSWHSKGIESAGYTQNQIVAGYKDLQESWGFLYTIKSMSGFNPIIEKTYLKMAVYEFYTELQLRSQIDKVEKEYKRLTEITKTT
jgi:hypothetical protein